MAEQKRETALLRSSLASVKRQFQAVWDSGVVNRVIVIQQNKHATGLPLDSSDIDWLFIHARGYAKSDNHLHRDADGRVILSGYCSGARWRSNKPVPNFGFDRWHQVIGLPAVEGVAKDAGRLLKDLPENVRHQLWKVEANPVGTSVPSSCKWVMWSEAVFALAWKEIVGSPLRANKATPVRFGVPSFTEPLPTHEDWYSMRDWYSTLDNFAAASVQAIDIIQSWLPDVPKREAEGDGVARILAAIAQQQQTPKLNRGGQRKYDSKLKKRIRDAWATGRHKRYIDCDTALKLEPGTTKRVLDTARK